MRSAAQRGRFAALEELLLRDPAKRGVRHLLCRGDLYAACLSLLDARKAILVTGFSIPSRRAAETDGPPGAVALGNALGMLNVDVSYLTDAPCLKALEGIAHPVYSWEGDTDVLEHPPTHLISIERIGRAADGRFYSMAGIDVGAWNDPIDELFLTSTNSWRTIGIGDGGNEIGMGKVRRRVRNSIPHGETIACTVPTDQLIVSGTSNWGAWGVVAGLSFLTGRDLLPDSAHAKRTLDRLVAAGAVDGVTCLSESTVDGISWDANEEMLLSLQNWLAAARSESPP